MLNKKNKGEIISGAIVVSFLISSVLPAAITFGAKTLKSWHKVRSEQKKIERQHRDLNIRNITGSDAYINLFGTEYKIPAEQTLEMHKSIEDKIGYAGSLNFTANLHTQNSQQQEGSCTFNGSFTESTTLVIAQGSQGQFVCYVSSYQ